MEWSGREWNGMEWMEWINGWSGVEWMVEWSGVEWSGVIDWNGLMSPFESIRFGDGDSE